MKDIFCKIIDNEIPSKVIFEDELVKVIMDVNPRSDGHLLVIPKKHYQDFFDIEDSVLEHIFKIAKEMCLLISKKLECDGFTLEQNNGISQEVKHFHLHIIPNYKNKKGISNIEEIYSKLV